MKASSVADAIISALKKLSLPVKTLTVDNGWEFTEHKRIAKELNCSVYFAKPYCSTDKALVENHNRLIMDFVPKGTDFTTISDTYWKWIQDVLNSRPRKKFGYKSPNQMVELELVSRCT
jgi:IS30 family transposase